ncbi:FAD-dependent monooxygenase terC [Lachnellula suecica]|uniref:FAD-dependent monooxygenase terC n=1 Tax=Lachnellula suecica TaxID=602035 RepID=A0A8T9CHA6_9HELO|nr:FAD-dependent monooxygenase terC [Lachnellula suecica]
MHVVIVGAGPTGFVLSLVLARAGIEVTLLDKESSIDLRPRAAHLAPAGIRVLKRAGILDDVRRAGFTPDNFTWRKRGGEPIVSYKDIGQKENPEHWTVLPLNLLGPIMLSHAEKNSNISVKFGHRVISTGQDGTAAWAVIQANDGTEKKVVADFLVGCDGGTSQVRKSIFGPRNFPGKTWDVQLVATNIRYPFEKYGYDDMNTIVHPDDAHVAARITKDGLWRVSYNEDTKLTHEEVVKNCPVKFERMLPGNPKPGEYTLVDINPYKQHQRCVEKMRVGRICVAADAAHLCNPWGGLGLTGGFADIAGLAECLEGIHSGQADHSILDKWDEVRRDIYQSYINPISTANFIRVAQLDLDRALEDPFFSMVLKSNTDPEVKKKLDESVYAVCHDFTQYYKAKA